MVYGIGVLTLMKLLKVAYLEVTHLWYAEHVGPIGIYNNIKLCFNSLKQLGPGRGYFTLNPQRAF